MAGYPMAWEVATSTDRLPETSPYSMAEMEDYLFANHYHWSRYEAPTTFNVSGPLAQKVEVDRRYWLFGAEKKRLTQRQEVWCCLCEKPHVLEPLHDAQANVSVDGGRQPQWFVVVGTGKGCFDPSSEMRRWMYAETNGDDDLSPDQLLEKAYREQLVADARS